MKVPAVLSDGKLDDHIGCRDAYGIEDTRQTLLEARRDGVRPFCVTIDDDADSADLQERVRKLG